MTGFELQTSGIGSDCSTNWATSTAHTGHILLICEIPESTGSVSLGVLPSYLFTGTYSRARHLLLVIISVTRFVEILPLWQKLTFIDQFFESLFLFWQNTESTLANLWHYWAIFLGANGQILKNKLVIWSHER